MSIHLKFQWETKTPSTNLISGLYKSNKITPENHVCSIYESITVNWWETSCFSVNQFSYLTAKHTEINSTLIDESREWPSIVIICVFVLDLHLRKIHEFSECKYLYFNRMLIHFIWFDLIDFVAKGLSKSFEDWTSNDVSAFRKCLGPNGVWRHI